MTKLIHCSIQSQTEKVGRLSMASYEKQPQFFDRVQVDVSNYHDVTIYLSCPVTLIC